jgi:protein dithiol:quinone oxidoreductase
MTFPLNYRATAWLIFLTPIGLLAYGYYLQFVEGLEPCPLCMTQRICFYGIAIFALLATLNNRIVIWQKITNALMGLTALTGLGVAARQLWLQSLPPDQVPACGPGFEFIMKTFPLMEALEIMFKGNGNCAEVTWTFLGLSIAGWSFIFFALFIGAAAFQFSRKLNR